MNIYLVKPVNLNVLFNACSSSQVYKRLHTPQEYKNTMLFFKYYLKSVWSDF